MCRNIQLLRGVDPPATDAEIRDAALQFVRKLSGYRTPSKTNTEVFDRAVDEVATVVSRLLACLTIAPGSRPVTTVQRRRGGGGAGEAH